MAMDIGTTTIYGRLVDLNTGKILADYGEFNKQIGFGEDVITRLIYAEKPGGLEKLHDVNLETTNRIIKRIIKTNSKDIEYTLHRSKRARKISISIDCEAGVIAVKPWFVNVTSLERFIFAKNKNWIFKHLEKFSKLNLKHLPKI